MEKTAPEALRLETMEPAVTAPLMATPVRPQRLAAPDSVKLSETVNWPLADPQPVLVLSWWLPATAVREEEGVMRLVRVRSPFWLKIETEGAEYKPVELLMEKTAPEPTR